MIKQKSSTEIIFYGLSLSSVEKTGRANSQRPVFLCTFKNDFYPDDFICQQADTKKVKTQLIHIFPARLVLTKKALFPQFVFPCNSIAWGGFDLMEYCFEQGIQDYACSPFNPEEIFIRSKKVLKVVHANESLLKARQRLTSKERLVFSVLFSRQGQCVSRKEIAFYSGGLFSENGRGIDMCISRVRKKVESFGIRIESVTNSGYEMNFL